MTFPLQLSYSVATAPVEGQTESGDQYLIKSNSDLILIAVTDGLGHGENAAIAAKKLISVLQQSNNTSLIDLINSGHIALQSTQGAVLTLASLQPDLTLLWSGVGNVTGLHWKANNIALRPEILLPQGGIIGHHLPNLYVSQLMIEPRDILILATDGIDKKFIHIKPMVYDSPKKIAEFIFNNYRKKSDDALVLVIRFFHEERMNG